MKLIVFFVAMSILLESTLITLPLTFLIILFASVIIRKNEIFALAFFSGLFLDILAFKNVGWSSIFFVIFVFLVFLYQRKFEVETLHFVAITALIGSFIYLFIEGVSFVIVQALVATFIISASFFIFKKKNKKIFTYA